MEELEDAQVGTDRSHDSGTESEKDYREQKVFKCRLYFLSSTSMKMYCFNVV